MNIDERRQKIINHMIIHNTVSVSQLISMMEQSPATVRRDLSFLEENGYIIRTRGYAKYVHPAIVHNIEITHDKILVAKAAAAMIPPNSTICLDSGISALALAHELTSRDDISIYTNSLSVLNVMAATKIPTYSVCGCLSGREEALLGSEAEEYIRKLHIPLLFLTTTGIRGSSGLVCVTPTQHNMKRAFIESSDKVVLLAEVKKFQIDSLRVFASFEEIDVIIVDRAPDDPDLIAYLKKVGTELIVADS